MSEPYKGYIYCGGYRLSVQFKKQNNKNVSTQLTLIYCLPLSFPSSLVPPFSYLHPPLSPLALQLVRSSLTLLSLSSPLFFPLFPHPPPFSPSSALFCQMQRPSFLRAEPPCVLSWLSSCLRGEEIPPFPYLPGICQRTRLLVLVRLELYFSLFKNNLNVPCASCDQKHIYMDSQITTCKVEQKRLA